MESQIGDLIRKAREKKGLSQTRAAKSLGFSEQFLGRVEAGEMPLPLPRVKRVKKVFRLTRETLLKAYVADYTQKVKKVLNAKTKRR